MSTGHRSESPYFQSPLWPNLLCMVIRYSSPSSYLVGYCCVNLDYSSYGLFFFFRVCKFQLILWLIGEMAAPHEHIKANRSFTESLIFPAHLRHLLLGGVSPLCKIRDLGWCPAEIITSLRALHYNPLCVACAGLLIINEIPRTQANRANMILYIRSIDDMHSNLFYSSCLAHVPWQRLPTDHDLWQDIIGDLKVLSWEEFVNSYQYERSQTLCSR